jgi:hypothetical protein
MPVRRYGIAVEENILKRKSGLACCAGHASVAGPLSQFADARADEGVEVVDDLEGLGPAAGEKVRRVERRRAKQTGMCTRRQSSQGV